MSQMEMFDLTEIYAKEFYTGLPVTLKKGALLTKVLPEFARFWFMSTSKPNHAWILAWDKKDEKPAIYLVPMAKVAISHNPVDPPPMPNWTEKREHYRWVFQRLYGKGI